MLSMPGRPMSCTAGTLMLTVLLTLPRRRCLPSSSSRLVPRRCLRPLACLLRMVLARPPTALLTRQLSRFLTAIPDGESSTAGRSTSTLATWFRHLSPLDAAATSPTLLGQGLSTPLRSTSRLPRMARMAPLRLAPSLLCATLLPSNTLLSNTLTRRRFVGVFLALPKLLALVTLTHHPAPPDAAAASLTTMGL